ncbi:MAG: ferritin-like domain-containing protein [Sulfurovum sp.]
MSYQTVQKAIQSDNVSTKKEITNLCLESLDEVWSDDFVPIIFTNPSYANKCKIVLPKDLKNRKDFDTNEGLASLVHAIAHIEYSAIDLALDAVYRYPNMPTEYQRDWLEVASDEIRHFEMLEELLVELGFEYGDFPVHCGLFDASVNTAHSILDRMAIVPRYFEASGLDVSPQIIKKLQNRHKIPAVAKLIDMLHIILKEEIDHVRKGDKWFKYLCQKAGVEEGREEEKYFQILEQYDLIDKHRPHINIEARKEAGFSCVEIKRLGARECG